MSLPAIFAALYMLFAGLTIMWINRRIDRSEANIAFFFCGLLLTALSASYVIHQLQTPPPTPSLYISSNL